MINVWLDGLTNDPLRVIGVAGLDWETKDN